MKLAYLPDKLKSVKTFLLTQINVCRVVTLTGSQEWFNGIYLSSKCSDYKVGGGSEWRPLSKITTVTVGATQYSRFGV